MHLFLKLPLDSALAATRSSCEPASFSRAETPAGVKDNAPLADVQKKRRGASRVSLLADRHFLNEFKALSGTDQFATPAVPSVRAIVSMAKGSDPSVPSLPSYATKTPRHWRDATDEIKAHFALETLRERGPAIGFTAWLSVEIDAKARATGAPLPWVRKRIVEALGDALGPVELLIAVEEEKAKSGKLLLHLHGVLGLGDTGRRGLARARQALRRALGAWTGPAARHQIKFALNPDAGWAGYMTKRCWLALPGIRKRFACAGPRSPWCISFDGPVLTMTNGTRARAKELHEDAREAVQEARQRAKTAPSPGLP